MKKTLFTAGMGILSALLLTACSDTSGGKSTPIEATNQTGVAPAQQVEGTPDTRIDATVQARDAHIKDTLGNRAAQTPPVGSGTNTSNTSDARTTAGSANNGDADKDRKK